MSDQSDFTLTGDHNRYMFRGNTEMDAVVSVSSSVGAEVFAQVAEVIVIDRSASMLGRKLDEVKRAAKAAIEAFDDGAFFALVAGDYDAVPLYPADGTLAAVSAGTRRAACEAVDAMELGSTTNTGRWLRLAADILATRGEAIGHALLLTDGRVNQPASTYAADLDYCSGRFTCDSVGIGLDWEPDELERIGERFHGGFEFCEDLADLSAHFTKICGRAMSRRFDDVELRVFSPVGAELGSLLQVVPFRQDLWPHLRPFGEHAWAFPLAAWGEERREYLLRVAFPPTDVGKSRAVRVEVALADRTVARGLLTVTWTNDRTRALAVDPKVAEHLGLIEYGEQVRMFFDSYRDGDLEAATQAIQGAYAIAEDGGHEQYRRDLGRVAYVDPVTQSVKLRDGLGMPDALSVRTASNRTQPMLPDLEGDDW